MKAFGASSNSGSLQLKVNNSTDIFCLRFHPAGIWVYIMASHQAYLSPAVNEVCYLCGTSEFNGSLANMAAAALCIPYLFELVFFLAIYVTSEVCFSTMKLPLSSLFQDIFQAFCPLLCCCVSLLWRFSLHTVHRRIMCFSLLVSLLSL